MFKNSVKTDAIIFYASFIGFVYAILYGAGGWWWAVSAAVHFFVIAVFSAIIHRYYCHDSFKANPTVAWLLSLVSTAYFYSSAIQWRVMHLCHHANADTEGDTHIRGWKGFLGYGYSQPAMKYFRAGIKLIRDKRLAFTHEYAIAIGITWGLFLLLIDPTLCLYAFVVPVFTNHFANRFHKQYGHAYTNDGKGGGSEYWWMEFIVPMGGEWLHKRHHIKAGIPYFKEKWYHMDPGGWIVRAISK